MDRAYAMLRYRYDAFIPYGQRKEVDKDEIPILNVKNVWSIHLCYGPRRC